METLTDIVKKSVLEYEGGGFDIKTFATWNDHKQVYSVLMVDYPIHKQAAGIIIMARVVGEYVIIEADNTDYPLVDVLTHRGIPRQNIICAYVGQPLPDDLLA